MCARAKSKRIRKFPPIENNNRLPLSARNVCLCVYILGAAAAPNAHAQLRLCLRMKHVSVKLDGVAPTKRSRSFIAAAAPTPSLLPKRARAAALAARGGSVPGGTVHSLPADLRAALLGARASVLAAWRNITPLARNEFICWASDAKQLVTREKRVRRLLKELEEGMRRPCCWPGCAHRERNGR